MLAALIVSLLKLNALYIDYNLLIIILLCIKGALQHSEMDINKKNNLMEPYLAAIRIYKSYNGHFMNF